MLSRNVFPHFAKACYMIVLHYQHSVTIFTVQQCAKIDLERCENFIGAHAPRSQWVQLTIPIIVPLSVAYYALYVR